MSIETSFEARLVPHVENHWDIVSARYEEGRLYITFKDETSGSIAVSHFSALAGASDMDFDSLEVSPCGLILENENIEWDYAEAGLYKIITAMNEGSGSVER